MRPESISIASSFFGLIAIACGIVLAIFAVRRFVFSKPWPPASELRLSCIITACISLAITLAICLVFQLTGFGESLFYRPSQRDYGELKSLDREPEEVIFTSADGTKLHGWWLAAERAEPIGTPGAEPSPSTAPTVIAFHGSDRNITYTVKNSAWLTQHSMNVFVFDYRGYGRSQGQVSRQGLVDDSVAAINYAASRKELGDSPLILYGQSMGGQLAIVAAAEAQEPKVQLVVSEATYAKHSYHLSDKLGQFGPLWLVKWGGWLLTSDNLCAEDAIGQLVDTPVLLIHGNDDRGVAPYHSRHLRDSLVGPGELWEIEGAGHLQIFQDKANQRRLADHIWDSIDAETEQSSQ